MPQTRRQRFIFRSIIGLELAALAYLLVFGALNAPAYFQRARFAARNRDLSADLAGGYVPREQLEQLAPVPVPATDQQTYPNLEIDLSDLAPLPLATTPLDTAPGQKTPVVQPKPQIPYVDPNVFVPNTITIPRIGVRAPTVEIEVNTEKAQQKGLENGVIHIAGTSAPGEVGNAFFAGHSSDFFLKPGRYKTVFALLPELHKGDYFILSDDTKSYYYTINETIITGPSDTSVLGRGGGKEKLASVQTSYPVGSARKRFIVVGSLDRVVNARR